MVIPSDSETRLLQRAAGGDQGARDRLLVLHRARLRSVVTLRLDQRLRQRVDPSDVVQETLLVASRRLDEYLREPPLPFFPWLRQIAWDRLVEIHRQHLYAGRRAQPREEIAFHQLSDESIGGLAARLVDVTGDPIRQLVQAEVHERVKLALEQLPHDHREILILRYLEGFSTAETAAVLEIGIPAAKMRHLRAVKRLRELLGDLTRGSST